MKIQIDGVDYLIPAEEETLMIQQIRQLALDEYAKLDGGWRSTAKVAARGYLQKLENEARVKYGKEKSLQFRPAKKADSVVHVSTIMTNFLREALRNVTISVNSVDHTIAAVSLSIEGQGASRRPLVVDGHIGERQDNGAQIP